MIKDGFTDPKETPNYNSNKVFSLLSTKIFEAEKWSVNYYAEVLDLEIVKRIELLPDESKHIRSGNKYYKITVGDLKALPKPIRSRRWRRITFIPTTFNQLLEAKEINDLYRTSPIEERLYLSLKQEKIPAERQLFIYDTRKPCCLDFAIFCKDGNLNVECDGEEFYSTKEAQIKDRKRDNDLTSMGWSILRFPGKEINQSSKDCVRQIKRTIKLLKGFDEELKT